MYHYLVRYILTKDATTHNRRFIIKAANPMDAVDRFAEHLRIQPEYHIRIDISVELVTDITSAFHVVEIR